MAKNENRISPKVFANRVLEAAREITGITYYKKDSQLMVDAFLLAMEQTLANGETVSFRGFGKFEVYESPARTCRNATGVYEVPAKNVVKFRPGKRLKMEVAQGFVQPVERVD